MNRTYFYDWFVYFLAKLLIYSLKNGAWWNFNMMENITSRVKVIEPSYMNNLFTFNETIKWFPHRIRRKMGNYFVYIDRLSDLIL